MSTLTPRSPDPTIVLSRADARRAGVSTRVLLGRSYQRVFFDAYVPSGIAITPVLRARVALRLLPQAAHVSHHTAVQLWGGTAPFSVETHVTVSERVQRIRRAGIAAHCDPAMRSTTIRHGMLISTPTQAFLELAAAGVSLVDLVVAGDSLVRVTDTQPDAFVEAAQAWSGHNARLARRAARLIRHGVDSAMETRLRLLIVLSGLPEPEVNFILRDDAGHWVFRFDLCYPELRLIVEYDGRQHAGSSEQWGRDIERREELDRLGWRLLVIRAEGVYTHPERTLAKIHEALRDGGAARVPPRLRTDWTRHFSSRTTPSRLRELWWLTACAQERAVGASEARRLNACAR